MLLALGAAAVGAAAAIGALAGDTERIGAYWTHASVADGGTAEVVEVIDYDFGPQDRHGILRDIPGVDPRAPFVVSSPTAPDQFEVTADFFSTNLKIGDPFTTIRNRHRYRIEYPIDTLVEGERFAWNAVGLEWQIPLNEVEVHVTADRAFTDLECNRGGSGDRGGCEVVQIAPGHLVVETSGLSAREAVTIEATLGAVLDVSPAPPVSPAGPADDPGTGWLLPGIVATATAVVAAAAASHRIRRLGREQVWSGGAADAAFGPPGDAVVGYELIDHEDLARMATIEFAAPRGLSAAAGGIIQDEGVESQHQIAWLIECAIRGEVELVEENGEDLVLVRGAAVPHPAVAKRLRGIFRGSDRVELGSYDSDFAGQWGLLHDDLEAWREASGLWDPAGHRRRKRVRAYGALGLLLGLGAAVLGGVLANRAGPAWLAVAAVAGSVGGPSVAGLFRAWELPIRTPEGSGRWLQIESFRRFIAGSEARHAEAAAERGLLRQYTAWAVALGELDHWKGAVEAAARVPDSMTARSHHDFHFVAMAPALSSATRQTFTAPSSSGGGGGGGGAGGGGGGGGGGSW